MLVGFSQGTMMALHVGLRRRVAPAAIVGLSGVLVGPEHLGEASARSAKGEPPPVLLVHGDQDDVIPVDALFMSGEELAKANIPSQWHLSIGTAHGIDGGALMHGGLFLAQSFGRPDATLSASKARGRRHNRGQVRQCSSSNAFGTAPPERHRPE